MRKLTALLSLAFVALQAGPSLAFEGEYRAGTQRYQQTMTIKKAGADGYSVELVVGARGCTGYFDGVGRVETGRLIAKSPPPAEPLDKCVVSISRKGSKLDVTTEDCNYWHGGSCEFRGLYGKR